ncbi:hypothetical protein BS47DRAFT_1408911 [Hydnum rufescens UP504]|uniref:Uncharacterized protein n=1 Tax=Hydnum rufescens UP504 TaxID=1448309 RepID=A0A9P6DZ95_9AGAM|nr:hypothetical protein BS47DRAFT_1408911 [Hydnum rufescens UP504]
MNLGIHYVGGMQSGYEGAPQMMDGELRKLKDRSRPSQLESRGQEVKELWFLLDQPCNHQKVLVPLIQMTKGIVYNHKKKIGGCHIIGSAGCSRVDVMRGGHGTGGEGPFDQLTETGIKKIAGRKKTGLGHELVKRAMCKSVGKLADSHPVEGYLGLASCRDD